MNEMDKLHVLLLRAGIPHEVTMERWLEGHTGKWVWAKQIWYPPRVEGSVSDAICHPGSYGYEEGLLEIMGLVSEPQNGSVEGRLTAEEVFARWSKHYQRMNRKEEQNGI